jgi:Universal stress protein family
MPAPGHPASVILDVAEEVNADLVVVGNRGTEAGKRLLLSGVPNKASHHCRCHLLDRAHILVLCLPSSVGSRMGPDQRRALRRAAVSCADESLCGGVIDWELGPSPGGSIPCVLQAPRPCLNSPGFVGGRPGIH